MIWYYRFQLPAVPKQRDLRWCGFRWSITLSIDYVWNLSIDRVIATSSCSYCVWNRYCQNHRSILPNFLMSAWFDTLEFNRLPCSNKKIYDDVVYAGRFRYQLTMFEVFILIGLSRRLDTHVAYEIAIYKSPLVTGLMRETISQAGMQWKASLDCDSRYMDCRTECEDISDSRDIFDL